MHQNIDSIESTYPIVPLEVGKYISMRLSNVVYVNLLKNDHDTNSTYTYHRQKAVAENRSYAVCVDSLLRHKIEERVYGDRPEEANAIYVTKVSFPRLDESGVNFKLPWSIFKNLQRAKMLRSKDRITTVLLNLHHP